MDYKKILQNLAYRPKVTSKDDPEYNNALRLYERLKEKYHVTDEELLDKKPPKIFVPCAICKNDIEFRGIPVFPICDNCRKIIGELVASHKSNWITNK